MVHYIFISFFLCDLSLLLSVRGLGLGMGRLPLVFGRVHSIAMEDALDNPLVGDHGCPRKRALDREKG